MSLLRLTRPIDKQLRARVTSIAERKLRDALQR